MDQMEWKESTKREKGKNGGAGIEERNGRAGDIKKGGTRIRGLEKKDEADEKGRSRMMNRKH